MICSHCGKDTEVVPAEYAHWDSKDFDAFWQLYPRKVAKASALKAWKKAATSEAIKDEIMAGLRKQLQIWGILDPLTMRYVPHASTYLNGRRWEDESTTSRHSVESRHIACDKCGDSGLMQTWGGANGDYPAGIRRCSCARGSLPGLVIPQADANDPAPL